MRLTFRFSLSQDSINSISIECRSKLSISIECRSKLRKKQVCDMKDDLEKISVNPRKKKPQFLKKKDLQRPSIVSNYSTVSLSDVTEESLEVWRALPEKIRQDPSLDSFRKKNEKVHGNFFI